MPSDRYILGLSALSHTPAAALLDARGGITAIEESKLTRERDAAGIPRSAIQFCFERTAITWNDLEKIAIAARPMRAWVRRAGFRLRQAPVAPFASGYHQTKAIGELGRELNNLRILGGLAGEPAGRVVALDHQLCHAASAFYASPFDRALILVLDEEGDGQCGMVAMGEGNEIKVLETIPFPHSLAWVYSQVTEILGFRPHGDEHKVQWLSTAGQPAYAPLFHEMLKRGDDPCPHINRKYFVRGFAGRLAFSDAFYGQMGVAPRRSEPLADTVRANLAASVQQACNEVVAAYAESLRKRHGAKNLCLAGGLFLNPLLVAAVERSGGYDGVFVQPAAGNEGTALGAAWWVQHALKKAPRTGAMEHLYWGPSFSNQDIKQVLDNGKAQYRWADSDGRKIEETLALLRAGKIVGWFQGAAEFGPGALGNRSLLASPWAPYVKENLNDFVKHRESFRPFALSAPEEDCRRLFDFSPASRFMASMATAKPEARQFLEDFLLPDGAVRLHAVERGANPLFWQLLKTSGQGAPAPLLVNTSFNLFGEPLVVGPRDAVRSYFCSGTDALVAGNFILTKS